MPENSAASLFFLLEDEAAGDADFLRFLDDDGVLLVLDLEERMEESLELDSCDGGGERWSLAGRVNVESIRSGTVRRKGSRSARFIMM